MDYYPHTTIFPGVSRVSRVLLSVGGRSGTLHSVIHPPHQGPRPRPVGRLPSHRTDPSPLTRPLVETFLCPSSTCPEPLNALPSTHPSLPFTPPLLTEASGLNFYPRRGPPPRPPLTTPLFRTRSRPSPPCRRIRMVTHPGTHPSLPFPFSFFHSYEMNKELLRNSRTNL